MRNFALLILASLVVGCGGGGGSQPTSYSPNTPIVGSQRISNISIVDNSNNTITMLGALRIMVTSVNADGSFVYRQDDPTNNSNIANGTDYSIRLANVTVNNSDQTKSITYTTNNLTCTFNPHGGGPTYPVQIGSEWSSTWTEACGNAAAVTYSQTGKVVGTEVITVPAGTFNTLHLTSTTTYTDSLGTTRTIKTDTYKNTTDLMTIKVSSIYSYSGTQPANGYPMSEVRELQSYQ